MPLHVATHPLIAHKMTILRDVKTNSNDFRKVLKEITFYLGYEASRTVSTGDVSVTTPMGEHFIGQKINEKVAIIPILRAGLGTHQNKFFGFNLFQIFVIFSAYTSMI